MNKTTGTREEKMSQENTNPYFCPVCNTDHSRPAAEYDHARLKSSPGIAYHFKYPLGFVFYRKGIKATVMCVMRDANGNNYCIESGGGPVWLDEKEVEFLVNGKD